MEKEYYDAQIKYINEIRSIKHDIQAHMIVLQYYLESENYEKAKAYLCDMKRNQKCESVVIQDTGSDLVNAIVSDTLGRSECKIDFEVEGLLPENFFMNEYDTCTLFSNVFSNACEACEKLVDEKPMIRMQVKEAKETYSIVIQNPIEWKIQVDQFGLLTSKEDKEEHGFGTKNMIHAVKKCGGKIDFSIAENCFQVQITYAKERVQEI